VAEPVQNLSKVSFAQINLPDHSYRWAVIKGFTWAGENHSDLDLIGALLAHPAYKDHYCAPGEDGVSDEPIHGSYRLDALSAASYLPVANAEALTLLDAWLAESGGDEPEAEAEAGVSRALEPVVDLIRRGDAVRHLPDLGEAAQHEWGWVLWHFREWVVLEHSQRLMHLISCGLD